MPYSCIHALDRVNIFDDFGGFESAYPIKLYLSTVFQSSLRHFERLFGREKNITRLLIGWFDENMLEERMYIWASVQIPIVVRGDNIQH